MNRKINIPNAGGNRNFKVTIPRIQGSQNVAALMQNATLAYIMLYASELISQNKGGYTKHYFEGTNRVCGKISGGFQHVDWGNIEGRNAIKFGEASGNGLDSPDEYQAAHKGIGRLFPGTIIKQQCSKMLTKWIKNESGDMDLVNQIVIVPNCYTYSIRR